MSGAWNSLAILSLFLSISLGQELIFVQAVWRHGDRMPTETYPTDPMQEQDWMSMFKGFKGWGQLTPKGMAQHFSMGRRLRERYVNVTSSTKRQILSPTYDSHKIYLRSTDVNRTIISAMSNLIGMLQPGEPGVDYPNNTQYNIDWPSGFVPIAVHTVNDEFDHIGNPDAVCPRQDQLWKMVTQTKQYKDLYNNHTDFFGNISKITNMTVNLDNLWIIHDDLVIKKDNRILDAKHVADQMLIDLFNSTITPLNNQVEDWNNGIDLDNHTSPDFNFAIELGRIRGGGLLWDIIYHLNLKSSCDAKGNETASKDPSCKWISGLNYYVYSAHDTTLAALFTTLGFKKTNYDHDGYPMYSSTITFELWKNGTGDYYIKVFYFPLNNITKLMSNDNMEEVTQSITGCPTDSNSSDANGCPLKMFIDRSAPFQPGNKGDSSSWCNFVDDLVPGKNTSGSSSLQPIFMVLITFIFTIMTLSQRVDRSKLL